MPVGILVYDADGNLQVDLTTKIARTLGEYTLTTSSANTGYIAQNDDRLAQGTPWYFAIPITPSLWNGYEPVLTFVGNNLTWSWPDPAYKNTVYILWGVYNP